VSVRGTNTIRGEETTYDMLRMDAATSLPKGMGSGGVIATDEGWARYPVAMVLWGADELAESIFQISYHNLNYVMSKAEGRTNRHFFFAA